MNKGNIEVSRCPMFDDTTKKLLSEPAVTVLSEYEDEMRNSYVAYFSENFEK